MIRMISVGLIGIGLLAGCQQDPTAKLQATCLNVMADPEVAENVTDAGLTLEAYCGCAATRILAMPEAASEKAQAAFTTMETAMADYGGSAEQAFEGIRDAARADGATPEALAAYEDLDRLGDQLEDILDAMDEAGGTCPA